MARHSKKQGFMSARQAAKIARNPSSCNHKYDNLWRRKNPKDTRPWEDVKGWERFCNKCGGGRQYKDKLGSGDKTS